MSSKINKNRFSIRMSVNRINKLKALAASKEKTMTQLVEDWIDTLPNPTPTEYDLNTTQQAL